MKIEICPDSWWRDRRPGARSAPPRTPPASRPPPASASPASTLSGSWSSSCWCWSSSPVSSRLCHCGKCLDHWRLWCWSDDDDDDDESLQRLDSTAEDWSWWWSDIALSDDNARLNLTSSLLNSLDTTEEKLPRCWQLVWTKLSWQYNTIIESCFEVSTRIFISLYNGVEDQWNYDDVSFQTDALLTLIGRLDS